MFRRNPDFVAVAAVALYLLVGSSAPDLSAQREEVRIAVTEHLRLAQVVEAEAVSAIREFVFALTH